jgi:hypothetical protein
VKRAVLAFALMVASSGPVRADGDDTHASYHAVVDRVELEPASIGGVRLRVYLSALTTQGQLLDVSDAKSIRLFLGTSEKKLPASLGTYGATSADTDIIVLVQATGDFAEALPLIADSLEHELLDHVADRTRVAVLMYGESVAQPKLATVKQVRGKVQLATDNSVADPVLLDAIDRALNLLKKTTPVVATDDKAANAVEPIRPHRKMIVVVGDGRDAAGDRERVTRAGQRAAKEGVRIHSIAYSPPDLRRTLLVLGELSKRSFGTFRWPGQGRKPIAETWNDTFKQLADEINKQNVITYYASADDDIAGKKLHLELAGRIQATSNELKVPAAPECAGAPCDGYCTDHCVTMQASGGGAGKIFKWMLVIGGSVVVAVVLLGFVGFLLTKRQERAARPASVAYPGMASMPPQAPQAGLLPNGRPIPALMMVTGPRAGERVLLRNGFLIGKQPGCDLIFDDGYTSSQHAQITMDPGGNCVLYDRGSTNGTFVNGNRIQQMALQHGVEIKIGSTSIRYLAQ